MSIPCNTKFVSDRFRYEIKLILALVLWYKRLDRGKFRINLPDGGQRAELDATQLAMLIDGIDFARVKRSQHWEPKR